MSFLHPEQPLTFPAYRLAHQMIFVMLVLKKEVYVTLGPKIRELAQNYRISTVNLETCATNLSQGWSLAEKAARNLLGEDAEQQIDRMGSGTLDSLILDFLQRNNPVLLECSWFHLLEPYTGVFSGMLSSVEREILRDPNYACPSDVDARNFLLRVRDNLTDSMWYELVVQAVIEMLYTSFEHPMLSEDEHRALGWHIALFTRESLTHLKGELL